jgi:hypothetical protein
MNDVSQEQQGTLSPAEQQDIPVVSFDADITIGCRSTRMTIDVYGEWMRGFPGTREMPAEPKYIDIRKVLCNDHDITDWLQDDNFAEWFWGEVYQR